MTCFSLSTENAFIPFAFLFTSHPKKANAHATAKVAIINSFVFIIVFFRVRLIV